MTSYKIIRYLLFGYISELLSKKTKNIEEELQKLGYDIGKRLLLLKAAEVADEELGSLMIAIVYSFLSEFFPGKREMSEITNDQAKNVFIVTEYEPFWNLYSELDDDSICLDSITAGIIKSVLISKGYSCRITTYTDSSIVYRRKIIHEIEIENNVENNFTMKI